MNWHGQASGKRGRSPTFSDEAIQFCLSIKCLFSLPLRQAMGMTQSLLRLTGLDWSVPAYSTVSRRQKTLQVAIEVAPTTTALHLLVDRCMKYRNARDCGASRCASGSGNRRRK